MNTNRDFLETIVAMSSAPNLDRIADGLKAADAALTLTERLAQLFRQDPHRRAARLRGKAARLMEAAKTAHPRKAARLGARAAGLLAEAQALEHALVVE